MLKKLKTLGGVLLVVCLGFLASQTPAYAQRSDIDYSPIIKVYALSFNPILEAQGNQRLSVYKGWTTGSYDEIAMIGELISSISSNSNGALTYQLVGGQVLDAIPVKDDGFQYTDTTYLNCLNNGVGCHNPDAANVNTILSNYNICAMANAYQIDEFWVFGAPYMGFNTFMAAGPTSVIPNRYISGSTCNRPLMITNFGYDTSVGTRYTNFQSRVVASLFGAWNSWLYGTTGWNLSANQMETFMAYQGSHPNQSACGYDHTTPNSTSEYGPYNIATSVPSRCQDFLNYPFLTNRYYSVPAWTLGCSAWGCTEQGFVNWWMNKLPKYKGRTLTKWDNWWKYVYDYDNAKNYNQANDPKGLAGISYAGNCRVKGWTCDPNRYSSRLTVDFYVGTTKVGSTNANGYSTTAGPQCGGDSYHGYDYTITGLTGGSKKVYARALDVDSNGSSTGIPYTLSASPVTVNCP